MGKSLGARVLFGVPVEIWDLPWYDHDEEAEGDSDEWWIKENSFSPTFDPYDQAGQLKVDPGDARIEAYWKERKDWKAEHPVPFDAHYDRNYESDVVFVCSPSTWMFEAAAPISEISELQSQQTSEEKARFIEFLDKYFPDANTPEWMLVPFYG